jgi:hypothetical protein
VKWEKTFSLPKDAVRTFYADDYGNDKWVLKREETITYHAPDGYWY